MKFTKSIGTLLLSVWLILHGLVVLFDLSFRGVGTVMAVVALLAGVFLLIGR